MTDRSAFLAYAQQADALPTKEVALPELGEGASIRVRCLKQKERLRWQFATRGADAEDYSGPDPAAYLITVATVNDDGSPMFSAQDSEAIAEMRGDVVERIAEEVLRVSGMAPESSADAEGKSETSPSTDSPSSSPSDSGEPSPS